MSIEVLKKEIVEMADQGRVNEALDRLKTINDIGQRESVRWMIYQSCVTNTRWPFVYLMLQQSYSSKISVLKCLQEQLRGASGKGWDAKVKSLVERNLSRYS